MKVCDLHTSSSRLQRATRRLLEQWDDVKQHWNDQASRDFESNHLCHFLPEVSLMIGAIQRLNEQVDRAERECDDRRDM